ncbi:hypothetical protein AALP_AA3G029000 [Arabis alpina]|uniref:RING-type E3 ubiquitin transferase n=1 Tax=Arabis alpina TaxID=50452 RepID=A0A087H6N4_ARAAL|nr:hypothetical protein AALP_AA3G029000 [Arabis alpina]
MSSTTGNPNPWGPYDSYKDCSQGVCSVYCPQWCYIIFPPPPSFFLDEEDDSSSSDFSPLLIALIGILASAFILVSYYTLISKYCHRRRNNNNNHTISTTTNDRGISSFVTDSWQSNPNPNPNQTIGDGLDESLIKSITVYKFKKRDGFVESSDCSVCLSEFQENESLRLLPKCNHAFHVPCIDTWLKSHSNCPLCRAFITAVESNQQMEMRSTENDAISNGSDSDSDSDSVVVNIDLETRSRSEDVVSRSNSNPKPVEVHGSRDGEEERRSVTLNSGSVVLIADILREIEDEEESGGVGTSRRVEEGDGGEKTVESAANQTNGISNFLVRSSMVAMKRSVSTDSKLLSWLKPQP